VLSVFGRPIASPVAASPGSGLGGHRKTPDRPSIMAPVAAQSDGVGHGATFIGPWRFRTAAPTRARYRGTRHGSRAEAVESGRDASLIVDDDTDGRRWVRNIVWARGGRRDGRRRCRQRAPRGSTAFIPPRCGAVISRCPNEAGCRLVGFLRGTGGHTAGRLPVHRALGGFADPDQQTSVGGDLAATFTRSSPSPAAVTALLAELAIESDSEVVPPSLSAPRISGWDR